VTSTSLVWAHAIEDSTSDDKATVSGEVRMRRL
jgi:hypothetical protein